MNERIDLAERKSDRLTALALGVWLGVLLALAVVFVRTARFPVDLREAPPDA